MAKPFKKSLLANFIAIAAICIALYWLFFASLGWITGHDKELRVPELKGKNLTEVQNLLTVSGFKIDIDSAYHPDKSPLIVIDQQPESGTTVKHGRTIFLIVNKQSAPDAPMPNLVTLSFRSAQLLLKSSKLLLGDTTMKPDMAKGAVLAQLYQGKEIAAGEILPQGSKIDLIVGDGYGNKEVNVPDLLNLTYPEAVATLSGYNLIYTVVFDGMITDTMDAVVYDQLPQAFNEFNEPNTITEGEGIDIRIRQSKEE